MALWAIVAMAVAPSADAAASSAPSPTTWSVADAEALVATSLPTVFSEGYSSAGGVMGVQEGPLRVSQRDLRTVDQSGRVRHVFQLGLFGFEDTAGVVRAIDTSIRATGTGYSPQAVGYSARIGGNTRAGVTWSDGVADRPVVRLIPLEAARSKFVKVASQADTVVAPSAWPSSDLYYVALGQGIKEHIVIRDGNAPTSFRFRVERPLHAKSRIVAGGGVSVDLRGSGTIALFPAPEGQAANGVDVPMWYTLKRFRKFDEITLHYDTGVQMSDGNWAEPQLPIDLDPGIYNATDSICDGTNPLTCNATPQASQTGAFADYEQGNFVAGLNASTTAYPVNAYGQWIFSAPPGGASWYHMTASITGELGKFQQYYVYDGNGDHVRIGHPGADNFPNGTKFFSYALDFTPVSFVAHNVHMTTASATTDRWRAVSANTVRTFTDDANPMITAFDPNPAADDLLPETFAASMSYADGQSGCGTAKLVVEDTAGQLVTEQSAPGCSISTTFTLAPGDYFLTAVGIDAVGNQVVSDPHRFIEIASATPQLRLDNPLVGEFFDQSLTLAGRGTALGLTNYSVAVDGQQVKLLTPTRNFFDVLDLSAVQEGVRQISVTANTLSGLTATQTRQVTIDHNPPQLAIDEPINDGVVGGPGKQFRATATDTVTAVAVTFSIDGTDYSFDQDAPFAFAYDSRSLSNAEHAFTARAVDRLGHTTTVTHSVTVDNIAPTAAIVQPVDGAELRGPSAIKVTGGDNYGVASMQVALTNERGYIIDLGTVTGGGTRDFGLDTTLIQNGPFELALIVTDQAGNQTVVRYHITINNPQYTTGIEDSLSRTTGPMGLIVTHDTGNLHADINDVDTDALGMPLAVARSYNHQDATGGSFGPGWRASFDQHLIIGLDDVATWIDPDGSKHHFVERADGSFTKPYGLDATLTKTSTGWGITEKNGLVHEFAPNGTYLADRARTGQHITLHRAANGALQSITDDSGLTLTVTTNGSGRVTAIRDQLNRTTAYSYDSAGHLATATDPTNATTTYSYDAQDRLISATDALTRQSTITYGNTGKVIAMHDPAGTPFTIVYGSATETIAGVETYYNFNAGGFLTLKRRADGNRVQQTYDERGNLSTSLDEGGRQTKYEYDSNDNLIKTTNPNGSTTKRMDFDAYGHARVTVDQFGQQAVNTYDAAGNLTREQQPGGAVTLRTYDAAGSPLTETDPNQGQAAFTYDARGHLTSETNALGHSTNYQVDAAGQTLRRTDADGNATAYTYDADGRTTSRMDPRGFTSTTTYDAAGRVAAQTDRSGGTTRMFFNAAGDMIRSTDPTGLATTYAYTPFGELRSMTDPAGSTTEYRYDAVGNRTTVIDPLGRETSFEHDPAGSVTAMTDPVGNTTSYEYDLNNQPTMVTEPNGAITRTSYRADGSVSSTTDAAGAVTTYDYTDQGDVAHTTSAAGGITAKEYDAAGNPIALTDPLTYTSRTVYDAASQPTSIEDPLGATKLMDYSPIGTVTTQTDENNHATTLQYDAAGNLTAQSDPEGGARATEYDPDGRLSAQVNQLGARMEITRDDAGRATQVTDYAGKAWRFAYDRGRLQTTTDPSGVATTYSYDAAGRMTEKATTGGDDDTYARDALGRVTSITDSQNRTTSYTYGSVGEITKITNPDNAATTYGYDSAGRLATSQDAAGHTASYNYDAAGRLHSKTTDTAGAIVYAYNLRDELTAVTTNAGTTSYVHDPIGRVTAINRTDGSSETFRYDGVGNVTSRTDATGTTFYTWDAANRLDTISLPSGVTTSYDRDPAGNVTSQTTDSTTTTYARDSAGRIAGLTTSGATTSYAYTPTSRVAAIQYPGWDLGLTWDANQRLAGLTDTATGSTTYTRNGAGRVITQTTPAGISSYEYSPAGRLAAWTTPGGLRSDYAYDSRGNLTSITRTWDSPDATGSVPPGNQNLIETCLATNMQDCPNPQIKWAIEQFLTATPTENPSTWNGVRQHVANYFNSHPTTTVTLSYDSGGRVIGLDDQIAGTHQAYSYDGRGNQVTAADQTRTFDVAGHLTQVTTPSDAITLRYDAADFLTTSTSAEGATSYQRDEQGRIMRLATPTHGTANIVYDDYGPHSIHTASGAYTYHYDQRGDVTALTDNAGNIAASYTYTPWGIHLASGDPDLIALNPYTLDGQELATWHPETGLYNMHHRWYDASQMRFISPDGQASQPSLADHPYAYAANDPINHTDPTGNLAWGVDTRAQTAAIAQALQIFLPPPVTPITPEPSLAKGSSFVPEATQPDESRYQNPRELPEYQGSLFDTEQTGTPPYVDGAKADTFGDDGVGGAGIRERASARSTCNYGSHTSAHLISSWTSVTVIGKLRCNTPRHRAVAFHLWWYPCAASDANVCPPHDSLENSGWIPIVRYANTENSTYSVTPRYSWSQDTIQDLQGFCPVQIQGYMKWQTQDANGNWHGPYYRNTSRQSFSCA